MLSIDNLKRIQAELDLYDKHIVSIGDDGFAIAHTDEERVNLESLERCCLHLWLYMQAGSPIDEGVYIIEPMWGHHTHGPWEYKHV